MLEINSISKDASASLWESRGKKLWAGRRGQHLTRAHGLFSPQNRNVWTKGHVLGAVMEGYHHPLPPLADHGLLV